MTGPAAARPPRWLRRALRVLACTLALGIAQIGAAAAEPRGASVEEQRQRARDHFVRGLELAREQHWDAALAEFLASRELFPTQVALKNAAICWSQLKRHSEAAAMYRELLAKFGASMPADERAQVETALAELASRLGRVVLAVSPAGASVVVSGRDRGVTPLPGPIELDSGTHTLRVWKPGYQTYETQVTVAGGQVRSVVAELVALAEAGILVVTEVSGRPVNVVLDGVIVGPAPWTGTVAPGAHVVLLQGPGSIGTAPTSATVRNGSTTTLRLQATALDSALRIEPVPSNAEVHIDGVAVGVGVWEGRLPSGPHQIEVAADGFVAFRGTVATRAGRIEVRRIALTRDLTSPLWRGGFLPHVYLEAMAGPAFAPSFGGGADAACSSDDGCERSRPFGFLAGARGGYELAQGLGVELFLGALYLQGSTRRRVVARGEGRDFVADDYEDSTEAFAPVGALSASARFFERTPLTFRVWAGVARLSGSFENRGSFTGDVVYRPPTGPEETAPSTQEVTVPEQSVRVWAPFFGPEARFGYRLGKRVSLDAGVVVLFMFPPASPRTGRTSVSRAEGERSTTLSDVMLPSGNLARGGLLSLPREDGFGTLLTVVPSLAIRIDL